MDIRSRQPSGRVPDRPRKPRHLGKAAGTREGIAGRPDRPFDGYPCLGSLALASGPDPADEQTLALVGVCVNRIGKVRASAGEDGCRTILTYPQYPQSPVDNCLGAGLVTALNLWFPKVAGQRVLWP